MAIGRLDGEEELFIKPLMTNMTRKMSFFIIAGVTLGAVILAATIVTRIRTQDANRSSETPGVSEERCLSEATLQNLLIDMGHGRYPYGDKESSKLFLDEAAKFPVCRQRIIKIVMTTIDKPDLDYTREPSNYSVFREGSLILADLKATEALDLLVKHLDLSSGMWSSTMSHRPTLLAVMRFGPPAVPALENVLRQSPVRNTRLDAVYCLAAIGGLEARHVLERAVDTDFDPCVNRSIRASLETLDPTTNLLKHDTGKWFSAFMCSN